MGHQHQEREDNVGSAMAVLTAKVACSWSNAEHRWENKQNNYISLCIANLLFLWKCSDASVNKKHVEADIRKNNAAAVRALGQNEGGLLVGMKTDLLAITNELLKQVEGDDQDASEIEDLLDAFGEEWDQSFVESEILSTLGKGTYTQ